MQRNGIFGVRGGVFFMWNYFEFRLLYTVKTLPQNGADQDVFFCKGSNQDNANAGMEKGL